MTLLEKDELVPTPVLMACPEARCGHHLSLLLITAPVGMSPAGAVSCSSLPSPLRPLRLCGECSLLARAYRAARNLQGQN